MKSIDALVLEADPTPGLLTRYSDGAKDLVEASSRWFNEETRSSEGQIDGSSPPTNITPPIACFSAESTKATE